MATGEGMNAATRLTAKRVDRIMYLVPESNIDVELKEDAEGEERVSLPLDMEEDIPHFRTQRRATCHR
jgi:hypothetical protein